MLTEFNVGDRVELRKKHACGGTEWEITRTGADVRIRCIKCGHSVMLDRLVFMRSAKKRTFIAPAGETGAAEGENNTNGTAADPCAE